MTPRLRERDEPPQTSFAVVSSHLWQPHLLMLTEQWFDPRVEFWNPINGNFPEFFVSSFAVGLMSWKDENALRSAHYQTDLDGGLVAGHIVRDPLSYFYWLPQSTCDLYPVHDIMEVAGLEVMTENASIYGNHMLCMRCFGNGVQAPTIPPAEFVQSVMFVDKVLKLVDMMNDLW